MYKYAATKVQVELCNGGGNLKFRLTLPDGSREFIRGEEWTRKIAKEARDLLECVYRIERRSIRFIHH